MPEKVDMKIARGDLSAIDGDGFYGDPDQDKIDEESFESNDGYIRECAEINGLLDRYRMAANERLRATVKVYDCREYPQDFLKSLLTR